MPIVNYPNFSAEKNPAEQLNKLLSALSSNQIEAHFVNEQKKTVVNRDYIEMVLTEYSQANNDVPSFNKWLQIDSTLDKALRKYKVELQSMLQALSSMSIAKSEMSEPIVDNAPPTPENFPQEPSSGRRLPTQ